MNTHHRLDTPALDRDLDYLFVPIETIENVVRVGLAISHDALCTTYLDQDAFLVLHSVASGTQEKVDCDGNRRILSIPSHKKPTSLGGWDGQRLGIVRGSQVLVCIPWIRKSK